MIREQTVFILGAGAGVDFGMPVGTELANNIHNCLIVNSDNFRSRLRDQDLHTAVSLLGADPKVNLSAAIQIREGVLLARSIDEFVDSFPDRPSVAKVAKIAIAKCILDAEKSSSLYVSGDNIYNRLKVASLQNSWLVEFFRIVSANAKEGEIETALSRVAFINFNYDRCLEQFLGYAISARFYLTLEESFKLVAGMNIVHPYGYLGPLSSPTDQNRVRFGEIGNSRLSEYGNRLLTYSESNVVDSEVRQEMAKYLRNATRICAMGFAFHWPNTMLLEQNRVPYVEQMFATVKGMSEMDRGVVDGWMQNWARLSKGEDVKAPQRALYSGGCLEFIREYSKAISE